MALGMLASSYTSQQLNNKPVPCRLSEKCWLCARAREKDKMVMVVINNNYLYSADRGLIDGEATESRRQTLLCLED